MKPVFNYTVACQACGASEPRPPAIYLNRAAMDDWVRYHRSSCPGRPAVHASLCWCDGCQGQIQHTGGPDA